MCSIVSVYPRDLLHDKWAVMLPPEYADVYRCCCACAYKSFHMTAPIITPWIVKK